MRLHADEFGGYGQLGVSDQALIRQAATLQLREEQFQEAVIKGERIDSDELTRLTNNIRRCLASIRAVKPKPAEITGSRAYLAERSGAPV